MADKGTNRQSASSAAAQSDERTARMLQDAWAVRTSGDYAEGRRILEEVESLCPANDHQTRGRMYAVYAQYDRDNGDLQSALALSRTSLEHYEKSGNLDRIAHTLRHIADVLSDLGRHTEAEERYQQALGIYRERADTNAQELANAARPYGILLKNLGRLEESRELLLEANRLYRESGSQPGIDETESLLAELATS